MASRAKAMIKKIKSKAGVKKPITIKQRVARKKNIAIARESRKRTAKVPTSKASKSVQSKTVDSKGRVQRKYTKEHVAKVKKMSITAKEAVKRQLGPRPNTSSNRAAARKELAKAMSNDAAKMKRRAAATRSQIAKEGFASGFNKVMSVGGGMASKSWAIRQGHAESIRRSKSEGKRKARKFAESIGRAKYKMTKTGAKQFAKGYVDSILKDLNR